VGKVTADADTGARPVRERTLALGVDGQREIAEAQPAADDGHVGDIVDGDGLEVLEVDHQRPLGGIAARREGAIRVPTGLGLDGDTVSGSANHGGRDLRRRRGEDDSPGAIGQAGIEGGGVGGPGAVRRDKEGDGSRGEAGRQGLVVCGE